MEDFGNGQNMQRQRGIAALEFALVVPVFFLICYSILTYGLIFVAHPYRTNPLIPLLLGSLMSVAVPDSIGSSATVQLD
ncbi:MAG: TadE/TadG family type IV pilus assembly protein [Noviherbaspirillum sp.]